MDEARRSIVVFGLLGLLFASCSSQVLRLAVLDSDMEPTIGIQEIGGWARGAAGTEMSAEIDGRLITCVAHRWERGQLACMRTPRDEPWWCGGWRCFERREHESKVP